MAIFNLAIRYLIKNEGEEYTDNPLDSGGATKFGITLGSLGEYWKSIGLARQPTAQDVAALSYDQAVRFYQSMYWAPLFLDSVLDTSSATAILDIAVNIGRETAVRIVQSAVNVVVDGKMGPNTAAAVSAMASKRFLQEFIPLVQNHYVDIVISNPKDVVFLKGWLARSQRMMSLM